MASTSALSSELAGKYGKAFVYNPQSVIYDPKKRELKITFRNLKSGGIIKISKAEEVAHSFEDFVEKLFCECGFEDSIAPEASSGFDLFSYEGRGPIATVFQDKNVVYIRPRTSSLAGVPMGAILPAYKKSILRNA